MSNTFTAQELADFYQKVADGGEIETCFGKPVCSIWHSTTCGPHIESYTSCWRIKPTKKVIDLSVLIDSQIDCEFKDSCDKKWHVSKADKGLYQESIYGTKSGDYFEQCRPRMNHIHAWQGGECPLPEGFKVKVWFRSGGDTIVTTPSRLYWGSNSETMAFEVLGLADGYVMPWEQGND